MPRLTKRIVEGATPKVKEYYLAGPTEVQHNIMLVGPQVEILRDELGTLIDPDAFWPPILDCDAFQRIDDVAAAVAQASAGDRRV